LDGCEKLGGWRDITGGSKTARVRKSRGKHDAGKGSTNMLEDQMETNNVKKRPAKRKQKGW